MATRTLGIKFEIAGLSEARNSLKQLKAELNNSIAINKKAVNDSVKSNLAIAKSERKRAELVKKTNDKIFFSYLGLRADVKRESQGMLADVQKSIRKTNQQFKDYFTSNFGSKIAQQQLIIKEEKADFRQRSTYKKLNINNRELVLEFRLAYREFFTRFEKTVEELKPEKTGFLEGIGSLLSNPISFAFDAILFPFQSAIAGMFERLGEVQTEDFAIGFSKNLQKSLGLSFEETGEDVGKIIGTSLYKVYQKSVDSVDKYVKGTLQFNLADTLIDAFKYVTKTLAKELPALALRTHRRIQLNKKAIPEARRAAGLARIENKLPEGTKKDIEENQSITLVYGGANTDSADIGKDYTARVMKPYLQGSAVIPMTRQWTNSAIDSGFQGDMRNLIKLVLSNQTFAQTFKSFVSENGLSALGEAEQKELMSGLDLEGEIDLSSIDRLAEIVESLLENKDFALGKALQTTFQGYNPDDVLGAAEAISIMEQFPDKELQIGGFSHGGYNALGTVDLLNRMGYTNVKGFSIGTPITGANATVNPDNFRAFMGDRDYYYKALTGLAGDDIDFPEFFEVGEKEGNLHSLQGYVRGDSVKGGLQNFLGDRLSIPSKAEYGKKDSAYGYAVGELGAETAIIRTLLTYLGENQLGQVKADEGFIFSAEETLPGYTGNLKKLGKGLKNEETKQFHTQYIDFLETLQAELEIAEQLAAIGKQYKPAESLRKAAKLFPQLEGLASKHTSIGLSYEQLNAAKLEAQAKEKLVFFQRKVKQQKDNIERTFQAMLGRKFTKKDEAKGIYSFYEPEEYEERAGNFEGMVNWLENDVLGGASEKEKESAQPILDLLHKITNSIRETGSTGNLDLATVREAEELLGIDLREFNSLFQEFERQGESKIDVNKFKSELRTFRRNRDQILTEKVIPSKIQESLQRTSGKLTNDKKIQQNIINAYNNQLKKIIQNANNRAVEALREGNININLDRAYRDIRQKIAEYRRRLAESSFQEARRIGEELLDETEYLKQIFSQSGDTRSGQLTRIQKEIISGDRGQGRSPVGLAEAAYSEGARQLEIDFESIGEQSQAGFEIGANGEETGANFAKEITEATEEGLDINSPSEWAKYVGLMVKKGFELGVKGIFGDLEEELEGIDEVAGQRGFNEDINNFFADGIDNISDFFSKLEDSYPIIRRVKSALVGAFGVGLQLFGIYSLSQSLGDLIRLSLDTAMGIESLDRSILAVSGNAISGAKNLSFISDEARRLQIDITSAKQAYQGLLGATKDTPLQGFATEQIFSAFAETAKVRGYSADETNRIFAAIQQSIGKRTLQSEEVKGQLSEVMGDIQGLIATSLGVDVSQLNNMMREGLPASEVWLKVASQLNAQNALLTSSTQTATSALTRYRNAATEFQFAIGKTFQPIQKLGLNTIAKALDWLREKSSLLLKVLTALSATVGVNLFLALINSRAAMVLLGQGLDQLIKLIVTALPKLLIFLRRFILISAAIETWANVLKLSKSDYADAQKDIEKLTLGILGLAKAYDDATDAKGKFSNSKMELQEGAKLPDNWFGRKILKPIVGGDRFNLDNLVRKRIGITTQAERKQTDFIAASGETRFTAGSVLNDKYRIAQDIAQIEKLDAKRREIESARLTLLPGDSQGYQDSLDAEKALLEQRDKFLKRTSQYQQNIDTGIQALKSRLAELAQLDLQGGDEEERSARTKERTSLLSTIEELETEKKAVAKELSKLAKELSQFDRSLRNTNERITGFNENQDRLTQAERARIIEAGVDLAKGDRVIQIELDDLTRRDLKNRISNLKREISKLEKDTKRPALAPGIERITNQLAEQGIEVNEASLNRIIEESTVQQDKDAAKALLALRANQASLSQYQEQLAQNLQQNRTTLIDFNRTITDYFFRLAQEIKEAQVEVKRLINQLFYGDLKSKLRSAIAPGSESFLNGIIEGVQGVIDQAASIAEKVLGQDSALIGFETKQYDLQTQLQDFARQIAGASDAVRGFIGSLRGQVSSSNTLPQQVTGGTKILVRRSGEKTAEGMELIRYDLVKNGQIVDSIINGYTGVKSKQKFNTKENHIAKTKTPLPDGLWKINTRQAQEVAQGKTNNDPSSAVGKYWVGLQPQFKTGRSAIGLHLENDFLGSAGCLVFTDPSAIRKLSGWVEKNAVSDFYVDLQSVVDEKLNIKGAKNTPSLIKDNYSTSSTQGNDILSQAQNLNQQRLNIEADKIDLQGLGINLDRQNLKTDIEQQQGRSRRQFETQARERDRAAQQLRDRFSNIGLENQLPTAEGELEKNLINVRSQFRDFDNEIFQQLQRLTDFVRTAQRFIERAPEAIAKLRARGTSADVEAANLISDTLNQTSDALPGYLELIKEIAETQQNLPTAQAEAIKFITEQGKLKIQQQELNKQSLISQLKLNIATLRGTNAQRKELEIAAEKLRLEQRINEIRQQYGNTDYAEELIKTERENSEVNLTKIDNEAVNRELNLEQQLINLQSDKAGKKAGLLNFIGLEFEAGRIQREAAVNSEMMRYKQQIQQLKQSYAGEPEKLAQLLKNAKELNQLNLDNIKLQFKSLGTQLQELSFNNLQGFFSNLFTIFNTGGERQQQILQANLDYAQKLNEAHDKFKRNPAELAQAKNRLKELNNQKLDGIRNEFNLFNRVVNFAKQAVSEFLKSFAQMMARRAAAGIFKSLGLGLGLGFKNGGTVPNFSQGGTIADKESRIVPSPISSHLKSSSLPIRQAFNREGSKGVLAVFTPGEEILSLRTGEAQRYQALKQELGYNPLQSVFAGNFATGGTIERNLLSNINTRPSSVRFDGSSLNRGTTNNINRSGTVNINVTTPDADSFRMSEYQLGLDAAESLRRSMKR